MLDGLTPRSERADTETVLCRRLVAVGRRLTPRSERADTETPLDRLDALQFGCLTPRSERADTETPDDFPLAFALDAPHPTIRKSGY